MEVRSVETNVGWGHTSPVITLLSLEWFVWSRDYLGLFIYYAFRQAIYINSPMPILDLGALKLTHRMVKCKTSMLKQQVNKKKSKKICQHQE